MSPFKRAQAADGFALPTAMVILFVMMVLAVAALSTINVQTRQSGKETSGEAAFNVAESVLNSEADQLRTSWPTSSPGWSLCTQASAPSTGCPGTALASALSPTYGGVYMSGATWSTQVVDDVGSSNYYDDSTAATAPSYDANGDNAVWLRAQATINGQKRVVVAQVVRQLETVDLPRNVLTAGSVYTSNNGNKVIIESQDPNSSLTGPVALRCGTSSPPTQPVYQSSCAGWDPNHGQLDPPNNYDPGYVDPTGGYQTLSAATLASLKATAIANGTYYGPGLCPPGGTAGVVYVENANCVYQHVDWNSPSAPGALIFAAGTLMFNGNVNFYGIVYMANAQGSVPPGGGSCTPTVTNGPVFEVHGVGTLQGAVFVDKCGSVDAGSSAYNIQFDPNAFSGVRSYATPGVARNTFRVLPSP